MSNRGDLAEPKAAIIASTLSQDVHCLPCWLEFYVLVDVLGSTHILSAMWDRMW